MSVQDVMYEVEVREVLAWNRVQRGAYRLDQVDPGWLSKIDLGRFDISDCYSCVVGQLWGPEFTQNVMEVFDITRDEVEEFTAAHALDIDNEWPDDPVTYQDLTEAWVAYIKAHRTEVQW